MQRNPARLTLPSNLAPQSQIPEWARQDSNLRPIDYELRLGADIWLVYAGFGHVGRGCLGLVVPASTHKSQKH